MTKTLISERPAAQHRHPAFSQPDVLTAQSRPLSRGHEQAPTKRRRTSSSNGRYEIHDQFRELEVAVDEEVDTESVSTNPVEAQSTAGLSQSNSHSTPSVVFTPTGSSPSVATSGRSRSVATRQLRHRRYSRAEDGTVHPDAHRSDGSELAGLATPVPRQQAYSPLPLKIAELDNPLPEPEVRPSQRTQLVSSPDSAPGMPASFGRSHIRAQPIQPRPSGMPHMVLPGYAQRNTETDREASIRKGRTGPLKNDVRGKVQKVREIGACMRCAVMKIACNPTEDDKPCDNCQRTLASARTYHLPCTREWLAKREKYLSPFVYCCQLELETVIPKVDESDRYPKFNATFEHYTGLTFTIDVFEAKGEVAAKYSRSSQWYDGGKKMEKSAAPPLIPWMPKGSGLNDYRNFIGMTLNKVAGQYARIEPFGKVENYPVQKHEFWGRAVLKSILSFQNTILHSDRLHRSLRTAFIRQVMGTPIYVPFEMLYVVNKEIQGLEHKLTEAQIADRIENERCWIPIIVQRFLVATLNVVFRRWLKETLQHLEVLLRLHEKNTEQDKLTDLDRDEAFCVIAVFLITIGAIQAGVMREGEKKYSDSETGKITIAGVEKDPRKEARERIKEIEFEVVDPILELWKYRFKKAKMRGGPDNSDRGRKAASFRIMEVFEQTKANIHLGDPGGAIQVDPTLKEMTTLKLDVDTASIESDELFKKNNITRLLLRLDECIYRPKAKKS